jgi:hypothetical protein
MIVGRVAVGEVAADCRQISHDRIRDDLRGVVKEGVAGPHDLRFLEIGLTGQRADPQKPVGFSNARQPGDRVDVDEMGRVGETELHQRDEALASREDFGVLAELRQQRGCLADRARGVVLEGSRNHRWSPSRSAVV